MPIEHHDVFKQPPATATLWRYTNLAKFVSMITTKALWFSNMYHLAKEDPFEGALPAGNFAYRTLTVETMPAALATRLKIGRFGDDAPIERKLRRYIEGEDEMMKHFLRSTKENFINCWHLAEYESAAMWKLYAEDSFGIAIISNLDRITAALSGVKDGIMCGMVDYIDYEKDVLDMSNGFTPAVKKRLSFAHEREVRLLHWDTEIGEEQIATLWNGQIRVMRQAMSHEDHAKIEPPPGKNFQCDLDKLVSEIRIAPTAPGWYEAAVRDFCKLAGFEKPISRSQLLSSPIR